MLDTLLLTSTDSPIKTSASLLEAGDDNVPPLPKPEELLGNEVTETKHNNKNVERENEKPQATADNDKKKNGSIGEARENYKFDVSRRRHQPVALKRASAKNA